MRVRTRLAIALAALLAFAPGAAVGVRGATTFSTADAPPPAAAAAPKVVIVVGATHEWTSSYRKSADGFANVASQYGAEVVKVYSPDATWSKVKAAAQGASILIYLGHGSGYPKSTTSTFNGDWHDGMGLNVASNPSDHVVKYYGENYMAADIRLARNAVVILSHLCYASGNSESGDPQPTIPVAQQRVDNFASGFLRSGARAVIADAWDSAVAYYIRSILTESRTLGQMWKSAPNNHDNWKLAGMTFTPLRNPAYGAMMDPTQPTKDFYRSIVADLSMSTADVRNGAAAPFTGTAPASLVAPGAAAVTTAGLVVHADASLASPTGTSLASGTGLRVEDLATSPVADDGTTPPPAALVRTLAGTVEGWVSGDGLAPRDSAAPQLWSVDGPTVVTPNFDGLRDRLELVARFSETVSWTARIRDGSGTVLRTLTGSGHQAFISWDPKVGAEPAPAGTYTWEVTAADAWGNPTAEGSGAFDVVPGAATSTAVLAFVSTSGSAVSGSSVTFGLTFAGPVTGLAKADLVRTGTASGCAIGTPTGEGASWTVPVTKCSSTGTVGLVLAAESVADATTGGLGPAGWISSQVVKIDRSAPTATAPKAALLANRTLGSTSTKAGLPVRLTWSGSDTGGAGVAAYDVGQSLNGGAWATVAAKVAGPSLELVLVPGSSYRFRVRAIDKAGNVGAWVAGPTLTPKLVQQTATAITWKSAWATQTATGYSGGSVRHSGTAGAKAIYTFSGRGIAFVTTRGPDRGAVKVYVDGSLMTTLDLSAGDAGQRVVVYSKTWSSVGTHTIRLVVVGTSGRPRVDVDAFEVLR